MNALLGQFLSEARDLIDEASKGFLALEDDPGDAETINTVFRAVHTIKGGSGLFEFTPITALVHAAEDVLDAVRHGRLDLEPAIVDLCFAALDRVSAWLDEIDATESLPAGATAESAELAAALRQVLNAASAVGQGDRPGPSTPAIDLAWLQHVTQSQRDEAVVRLASGASVLAVSYQPQEHCFFGGDDPFAVVRQVPDLLALRITRHDGVDRLDDLDPYRCGTRFEILTGAERSEVDQLFRYVPDDVHMAALPADAFDTSERAGWLDEVRDPREREVFSRVVEEQAAILALPCAPPEFDRRLTSVAQALRNCFLYLDATEQLSKLDAAVARAAEARSFAPLLQAVQAWRPARPVAAVGESASTEDVIAFPTPARVMATDSGPDVHASAPAATRGVEARRPGSARAMKVDHAKVDQLMTLIGEMVVAKNALPYLARRAETVFENRDMAREIKEQHAVIHRITEGLQLAIMQVRMLPVGSIFERFPRLIRDLSRKLDKQIALVLEGEDTAADKNVIESLSDPLIHLVRNSADHGIEPAEDRIAAGKPPSGTIRLRAFQDGDRVIIEVIDDGAGIDPLRVKRKAIERGLISAERAAQLTDRQAIALVLEPGFSLAEQVSDLSGRGVGMDVVRSAVEAAGGTLALESTTGVGTTVRLGLPLSMAVTRLLVIGLGDDLFGVPIDVVVETLKVPRTTIRQLKQEEVLVWRGTLLPVRRLAALLGRPGLLTADAADEEAVLVIRIGQETVAVVVSRFLESTDVILKPLGGFLGSCRAYSGTAILGDGHVMLALDFKELI